MSRMTAAKSRADKSAAKTALAAATPVTHDIVPGKFTDHDWIFMLERDDGDDFIAELLDELYDSVDRIIFADYIQDQLIPYTVTWAKDSILQIIEWEFLARDEGEVPGCGETDNEAEKVEVDEEEFFGKVQNIDSTMPASAAADSGSETRLQSIDSVNVKTKPVLNGWKPDEEPLPAVTDCWAQGSVPKLISRPRRSMTGSSVDMGVDVMPTVNEADQPISTSNLDLDQHDEQQEQGQEEEGQEEEKSESVHSSRRENVEDKLLDDTSLAGDDSCAVEAEEREAAADDVVEKSHVIDDGKFRLPDVPNLNAFLPSGVVLPDDARNSEECLGKTPELVGSREACKTESVRSESLFSADNRTARRSKKNLVDRQPECLNYEAPHPPAKSKSGTKLTENADFTGPIVFEKIKPSRLPTNQINTLFCLVDPSVEEAEERRRAFRNGRRQNFTQTGKMAISAGAAGAALNRAVLFASAPNVRTNVTKLETSPLLEKMELSGGVIVRENGRVKKGPKVLHQATSQEAELLRTALRQGLQPVRVQRLPDPQLSATDLLDGQLPIIRPLADMAPIPPINHQITSA